MEQWRQLLNASAGPEEVSILDSDVTGIKGTYSAPDGVFYSEFSEEDAIAYHEIFANFAKLYELNSRIAISGLGDELYAQNNAVGDRFCPIELILFSSRCAGQIIASNTKVFRKLKIIIGKLLNDDAPKIAQYILGGWEWKTQMSIFVEAIGNAAPELVDVAMQYYPQAALLCEDDDKGLLKSYVNMILATQDESFTEYLSEVVTNDVFMHDNEAIDYFCKAISRDPYWKSEEIAGPIIEEIEGRAISPIFRKRITDLKRQLLRDHTGAFTVYGVLNSRNFDYETKVEWANKLLLTGACAKDIYEWERVRDPEISVLINRRAMKNIETIVPDEMRGRVYVALATHAKQHRNEVIDFLTDQQEKNPRFLVSINIALYDLRLITSEELLHSLFHTHYYDFTGKNLGKYFRYNKVAFSNDFVAFLKRYLKNSLNEIELNNALAIIYQVLEQFNSKDGKLSDEVIGVADAVTEILTTLNGDYRYSDTYRSFLDILDLIAITNPSNKRKILDILYRFKQKVSENGRMPAIEFRINSYIKKLDSIVAPSGL
ncbi:MAG: hypothetical protein IJD59_05675 [Clostridia bacterium]|nr:hypothetical protein [Clostridia bacterium]